MSMSIVNPLAERVKLLIMAVDPDIRIQMNLKELTKPFMMISI